MSLDNARAAAPHRGPIRSMLYLPGHRDRWVDPARASGADAIVFDLEDAVPFDELPAARSIVRSALDEHGSEGPRLFVRTAAPTSDWIRDDLEAVVCSGLAGVLLPLVAGPEDVQVVDRMLSELEGERGLPLGSTIVVPIVETARCARFAYEVASASARVDYMGGGTSQQGDLARELGYRWTPLGAETLVLRSWVLMNVRAAGVAFPISGMWSVLDDPDGLRAFALQSRGLGYAGLSAIHPSQIDTINEVFTPTDVEIDRWHEVIETMKAAQADGVGAMRHRGELIDEAHVKTAELGLDLARKLGKLPMKTEEQ